MFALWSLYKLLWKTSCNIQTKAVRVEQSDKLLRGSERWGSVNSNPPDEDLLTSERLLKHYCIFCHWHQLRHPKQVFIGIHRPLFFPLRLLCWFFTTRRRIQTCGRTISALTQPKIWSPGWRLWRMQHWSTLSQSEGKKTCFGSLWTNQKVNIQIPCTTSMTFIAVHFSVCFPRLRVSAK